MSFGGKFTVCCVFRSVFWLLDCVCVLGKRERGAWDFCDFVDFCDFSYEKWWVGIVSVRVKKGFALKKTCELRF